MPDKPTIKCHTVQCDDLRKAAIAVQRLVGRGGEPVHIRGEADAVTLSAWTQHTCVRASVVSGGGDAFNRDLSSKRLSQIASGLRASGAGTVDIGPVADKDKLVAFRAEEEHRKLDQIGEHVERLDADTPEATFRRPDGPLVKISYPADDLCALLDRTLMAVSHAETRPILTGLYIECVDGATTFTGTDTYRLYTGRVDETDESPDVEPASASQLAVGITALVDWRWAKCLVAEVRKQKMEHVTVEYNFPTGGRACSHVAATVGDVTHIARCIDGVFPNYRAVIPAHHERALTMNRAELIGSLTASLAVAREDAYRVIFSPKGCIAAITAACADRGAYLDTIACKQSPECDDGFKLAFDVRYALDVLKLMRQDEVTLLGCGPLDPLQWIDGTDVASHDQYVLMPMQIM